MADKVVYLDVVTRLDIPPERVLNNLPKMKSVLVMGWDENDEFYVASSMSDGGDVLWLMELTKKKLMERDETE
jgi:hypothetical protein